MPNSKDFDEIEDDYGGSENELANLIFNRKGRLDVKKPGPFFPGSANNFFLNKVKSMREIALTSSIRIVSFHIIPLMLYSVILCLYA